jgi:N utilization substance protein A
VRLPEVIDELVDERGLDRAILGEIIAEGILAAYQKKYPEVELKAEYDKKTGEVVVFVHKKVVSTAQDDLKEISLKKARFIDKEIKADDQIWLPFEGTIGRIEILKARQLIANKIRKIEATAIYNEFKEKEGEIVHGTIHKCERGGFVVKIDDSLAFLPKSLTIPNDKCIVGYPIKTLLKEVLLEPRNDNQLILDRASDLFLQRLFELEIPEIFEKLVEIKKIVRIPGYKAKIIVFSHDKNIDPVGTCVGVGGSRIKPILKEIANEKIDVIAWSDQKERLIKDALKPAQIDRVEVVDDKIARVWLNEDQRSLAIGRMGQNIALASRLVGIDIQLVQKEESRKELEGKPEFEDVFGEQEENND